MEIFGLLLNVVFIFFVFCIKLFLYIIVSIFNIIPLFIKIILLIAIVALIIRHFWKEA